MSVVTAQQISGSPAPGFADVLRTMPGLNLIETAASDIFLTSRPATGVASRDPAHPRRRSALLTQLRESHPLGFRALDLDDAKQIECPTPEHATRRER